MFLSSFFLFLVVTLDLNDVRFGTKSHDRIKKCLTKLAKINLILTWHPSNENVCPSSIAKYFANLNYDVKLCKVNHKSRTNYSITAPIIDFIDSNIDDCHDYVEWIGMVTLNADLDQTSEYLSSYKLLEPNQLYGQLKILEWRGFYSNVQLKKFYNKLM